MHAIILAGGAGTRLQSVVSHVPKPMAPVRGRPFLAYLLDYLSSQGMKRVTLLVGYLQEMIQAYFQRSYAGMAIDYVVEDKPLGTGGAIAHALNQLHMTEPVFVLNGDTFAKVDYRQIAGAHVADNHLTMVLRFVSDCRRYGSVLVKNKRVTAFQEKGESGPGFINAGVYLLQPTLFNAFDLPEVFSLERDFLQRYLAVLKPGAYITQAYVLDIGTPEAYRKAQHINN